MSATSPISSITEYISTNPTMRCSRPAVANPEEPLARATIRLHAPRGPEEPEAPNGERRLLTTSPTREHRGEAGISTDGQDGAMTSAAKASGAVSAWCSPGGAVVSGHFSGAADTSLTAPARPPAREANGATEPGQR